MPLRIVSSDITKMKTDAIVNASNKDLVAGSGVCGAIYAKAGYDKLSRVTKAQARLKTGDAIITLGYDLPARYIIHTVGPIYYQDLDNAKILLRKSYYNCLVLAQKYNLNSIAFPLISTGLYGYPIMDAFDIAISVISDYLQTHYLEVYLVIYHKDDLIKDNTRILNYLNHNLISTNAYYKNYKHLNYQQDFKSLEDQFNIINEDELIKMSFNKVLKYLIKQSSYSEYYILNHANLDVNRFLCLLKKETYYPSKNILLSLAFSLGLDYKQTTILIRSFNYVLDMTNIDDVIVSYCLKHQISKISEINKLLFIYGNNVL
ncbi:MAG: macro domain-containing protein [Bacilli bacterium]|nr:macro domain-containing protein [Bacilli bacterium]